MESGWHIQIMRISARCDYACRAVLELAMHWPKDKPLQTGNIARKQKIPMKYLVHILLQLKRLGIVQSIRGKDGGYILKEPPGRITLGRIVRETSGPLVVYDIRDVLFSSIWAKVEDEISRVVDNITFEEICNKAKGGVYYI